MGLTYKHSSLANRRHLNRVFPAHCLTTSGDINKWQSTKNYTDVSQNQAIIECQYRSKQFFKQKYEQKDFIEVLLRAKVNPNKREQLV